MRYRGNKDQLRQLLTDVRDGLVVISKDGIVRFANPAVREQLGLDPDALTGAPFPLPDCDSDGPRQVEVHGRTRHLEITRTATTWDEAPATLLALRDVTDKHEQEEWLRLLNRAMESSANGIVIVDSRVQGQPIIYANPAFLQMTGYGLDEVIGRNCRFLQGAERDQAAIAQIRDALRDEREGNAVLKNVRKNGEDFWNDLHIAPVCNEAGRVTHYVGVRGYSSLSYLKRLPFDTLKIDRDFVRDLPHDPDDAAIARTIVLIAHQLRMTVTAEGVETEAQRSFLQGLGCERLQGFLLGRPAPAEDAARLIAAPPVAPPRPARRDVANRD